MTDYYGNSWTAFSNAAVGNTSAWKSGEKHIVFDGNGDYIKTSSLDLDGDAFTVRWRERFDTFAGPNYHQLIQMGGATVGTLGAQLRFQGTSLRVALSSAGTSWDIANYIAASKTTWTTNQWYEFELSYSATSGYRLYTDGSLIYSNSRLSKLYNPNQVAFGGEGGSDPTAGALADLYITGSETLHTSGFTPLSDAYVDQYKGALDWSGASIENVVGGSGNDTLTGSNADNVISGGLGNDTLQGGAGNDTLSGGAGSNVLDGGSGNDVYVISPDGNHLTITDSSGIDTLSLASLNTNVNLNLGNTANVGRKVGNQYEGFLFYLYQNS
jgi:Ca2+-binding RTX toxin-like protein